jgi:hypothetical protein
MLACPVQDGGPLTQLVYEKSQGNPFFIHAFLKCLHAEGVLRFDFPAARWTWNAGKVGQLRFTENIVELMAGRIQKLPAATREALRLAACLGYGFNTHVLTIVLETTRSRGDRTAQARPGRRPDPARRRQLPLHARPHPAGRLFAHSRGRQKREHLRIGNALLRYLDDEARNQHLFEIVNQLNVGIGSLDSQERKTGWPPSTSRPACGPATRRPTSLPSNTCKRASDSSLPAAGAATTPWPCNSTRPAPKVRTCAATGARWKPGWK